jgi:hypothetical protein
MSNKMIINNEKLSQYLGTEDAVKGLQKVVDNGQTRLALEVIFDIITQLIDRIDTLEEIVSTKEDLSPEPAPAPTPAPAQEKPITKAKETTTEISEEEKK